MSYSYFHQAYSGIYHCLRISKKAKEVSSYLGKHDLIVLAEELLVLFVGHCVEIFADKPCIVLLLSARQAPDYLLNT